MQLKKLILLLYFPPIVVLVFMFLYRELLKRTDTYSLCRYFVMTVLPVFVFLSGTSAFKYSVFHIELWVRTCLDLNNIHVIICMVINQLKI